VYCINPDCQQRHNPDHVESCQTCGTELRVWGRYRLIKPLRELHSRYSTEVFEIDDRGVRKVMKILKSDRRETIDRFEREAFTLQFLNHPGIPKVELDGYLTFSAAPGFLKLHCIVMEKIEGLTLEEWVEKNGKVSQKLALDWLKQLLVIVEALHQENFFHRDIKPSNIICKPDGNLVLIDFGSVREMTDTYLAKLKRSGDFKTERSSQITSVISGGYTPQEQMDGKALPQSDLFALGRTFVYLMTGIHPTELPMDSQTGQLIWRDRAPDISYPLAEFIDELMAPLAKNRPQNIEKVQQDLAHNRLLWRRIQLFLKSPTFKVIAASNIAILLALGGMYRLSFPWQAQYYYERGVEAHKANHLDLARQNYEKARKFNNKDFKTYTNLGLICSEQKNIGCAEQNYKKSLQLEENATTYLNFGRLYEDIGDFDRAIPLYQQSSAKGSPLVAANALKDEARLNILQGKPDRAIELSLQGLEKTQPDRTDFVPVRSALYRNLGWAYWMQAEYTKAWDNLQKAIELDSERADVRCLSALVLESQGKSALDVWQKCLEGDTKNRLEVSIWQTMARQRLQEAKKRP
jgi:serine/threonine protein kinase